jgi:hypothetical protein
MLTEIEIIVSMNHFGATGTAKSCFALCLFRCTAVLSGLCSRIENLHLAPKMTATNKPSCDVVSGTWAENLR